MWIVPDDVLPMPVSLRAVVGVERFGDLVFQRRSRLDAMKSAAATAGAVGFVHLRTEGDRGRCPEQLPDIGRRAAVPALPVASDPDLGRRPQDLPAADQLRADVLSIPLEGLSRAPGMAATPRRPNRPAEVSLMRQNEHEVGRFLRRALRNPGRGARSAWCCSTSATNGPCRTYLSGQFDARHFNVIEHKDYTVTKNPKDREKLRREYELYRLLPPSMQMFAARPALRLHDDAADGGSYSMERLVIPDYGAAAEGACGFHRDEVRAVPQSTLFHFIAIRPERQTTRAEMEAASAGSMWTRSPRGSRRSSRLRLPEPGSAAIGLGGADALVERYLATHERMR